MLDYSLTESSWEPPKLDMDALHEQVEAHRKNRFNEYLIILNEEPYIDAVYVKFDEGEFEDMFSYIRFAIHEGNAWGRDKERLFIGKCLKNDGCLCDGGRLESIYGIYSAKYPEWKLKRYLTGRKRMLDHIYHCFKKNTVREILYKAELDELAFESDTIDEYDLLSTKPSDIYDGLSLRTLRALNCAEGAVLLSASSNRCFVKELQKYYPDIFRGRLNDAQCKYLKRLIDNDLTVGETGRLFLARSADLARMWVHTQYETFISIEKQRVEEESIIAEFAEVDPFYSIYLKKYMGNYANYRNLSRLRICLFVERDEYDKAFRRSNREREYDWQERNDDYIVRYPQTINDFCREVVYQRNCLMGFLDSVLQNDTTILFMRKAEDQNMPFITIEIFKNRLIQAYHRLNRDCMGEEAEWIQKYCRRHGIDEGNFKFNVLEDDLM